MLVESGIDLERDRVRIVGVPAANEPGVSFGVTAARALEQSQLDGFWANAMGAENAVRGGVGKVVLDVRRGIGPALAFHYTMPVLATPGGLAIGAASVQQVDGAGEHLIGAVAADNLERKLVAHRRFSRSAADCAL
jgi:hypothetical protein